MSFATRSDMDRPSDLNFERDNYPWKPGIDYRRHPELYRVGKGEQGVLICEPYKSEIGRHWRFRTMAIAEESSKKIFELFELYLAKNDFVGADMARKYLQMGYTRARRYANYKGGKKYDDNDNYAPLERGTGDPEKAAAAKIFYNKWKAAEACSAYAQLKKKWKLNKG
ncbi:DUF4385 domain-containing protein [Mucilaginibacter roseus]|uniref:DUF4385 domain-containing protein n=1 Tax=Mucilaginibacter roseus TaxID=1528868 RepID=A0ABS8U2R5_9SPHI|nr:DUF4385 domain-containing protein [Mucilaginibacter roseus]MCD8739846.1 DUF4385 domain-containing protein [Mucilaginibacter roseus]